MFKTQILNLALLDDCKKAAELLLEGNLVAIPTETVYGLAADATNPRAICKIFDVKKRPNNHPLIVHIDNASKLERWACNIPSAAYALAQAFWPGPLTMILHKKKEIPSEISGGLTTIALRVPNQPKLRQMMHEFNLGLVAPSANLHKKLSPTLADHVYKNLYGLIPAVLDGGACQVGLESTIIDLTQEHPVILRKGPITKKDLEKVLLCSVLDPKSHSIAAPGNMHIHYQPYTKSHLVPAGELLEIIKKNQTGRVGFLHYTKFEELIDHPFAVKLDPNKPNYAAALYSSLHQLDSFQLTSIYVQEPPSGPEWDDVKDRLIKATN